MKSEEKFEAHIKTTAWHAVLSGAANDDDDGASIFRMARMAASEAWQAALAKDAWVSVDDRLPNERERVLVFRPDAHHLPACDPNIDVRAYFGNGVFNGLHIVTHWMPLPAPPA